MADTSLIRLLLWLPAGLLYQIIRFQAVLLCGFLAAISFYNGLPIFERSKPRWIAAGAAWTILGIAGLWGVAA